LLQHISHLYAIFSSAEQAVVANDPASVARARALGLGFPLGSDEAGSGR
jgi:hypothetical protein